MPKPSAPIANPLFASRSCRLLFHPEVTPQAALVRFHKRPRVLTSFALVLRVNQSPTTARPFPIYDAARQLRRVSGASGHDGLPPPHMPSLQSTHRA